MQPEIEGDKQPAPPSKAAKLLAVGAFYMVLFFVAGVVGLPVPVGLAAVFFVTGAAPAAFLLALVTASLFRFFARRTERPESWPFFDVALQTFIVVSLLATGAFVVRFPVWLENSYPEVRADVESYVVPGIGSERKAAFLEALDRFWALNVKFLLQEGTPPSEIDQQRVRDAVAQFGQALSPACPECGPELDAAEVEALTAAMNTVTRAAPESATPASAPTAATSPADATAAVTGATAPATAPTPAERE